MTMQKSLCLVIPTAIYKQWQWFWQENAQFLSDLDIIVVANFDQPGNTQAKNLMWIKITKPLGFAKTVNLGLRQALTNNYQFIGTCNDDVILSKNSIDLTTEIALKEKWGAINPIILSANQRIESAGIKLLPIGKAEPQTQPTSTSQIYLTQAFNGACVIFNPLALQDVGLFAENFGSYLEDLELSLRMKKENWQIYVNPKIEIIHYGQQTSKQLLSWRKTWLDFINWWRIILSYTDNQTWKDYGFQILTERARNAWGVIKAFAHSLKRGD